MQVELHLRLSPEAAANRLRGATTTNRNAFAREQPFWGEVGDDGFTLSKRVGWGAWRPTMTGQIEASGGGCRITATSALHPQWGRAVAMLCTMVVLAVIAPILTGILTWLNPPDPNDLTLLTLGLAPLIFVGPALMGAGLLRAAYLEREELAEWLGRVFADARA